MASARLKGTMYWHRYSGATLCGAAEALAATLDVDKRDASREWMIEVTYCDSNDSPTHLLTVRRQTRYEVTDARGGD